MKGSFSRLTIALMLASSLLASSLTTLARTSVVQDPVQTATQGQTTGDAKTTQSQTQSASQNQSDSQTTSAPAKPANGKPLSVNEDPAMIGKRNINKGMIIPKIAGSTEKEVRLGRELAAEIDREAKFIDDPMITEYVNRVGQNIVLHSDAKVPFTIKVIDSDEVNAFALPGGFFYVNKGLLLAADNEAELAGVMAHEIGHVAARHAVENQAKMQLLDYAALAGSIFLGGWPGVIYQNTAGFGLLGAFMKFSRGAEEEADRLGVQYMYAAGYDPNAMATMFEKLEAKNKKKPGTISKLFASHPAPPERRAAALALAARFPEREEYIISTSEFQRVKSRLLRMSNARASSVADTGGENGPAGRPTLKRRQSTPDESTTPPDSSDQNKPSGPPKLKRNEPIPSSSPSPSPEQ